jgi:transcriptional regulator with XRE-family HTH domain
MYNEQIIKYILAKKNIRQSKLAEMLKKEVNKSSKKGVNKPFKKGIDESTLSRWKNKKDRIPPERLRELYKIAQFGEFTEGQAKKWSEITRDSKEVADDWYWKFAAQINTSDDSIWNEYFIEINYHSSWIDNIQKMLISLNNAGVPVQDSSFNFTFEPTRDVIWDEVSEHPPYDTGTPVMTAADKLLIAYIKKYEALRNWAKWYILYIDDKKITERQFELALKASDLALSHIPRKLFEDVGTNLDILDKYVQKTKHDTFALMSQFAGRIEYWDLADGVEEGFDYLRYISEDTEKLEKDVFKLPRYIKHTGIQDVNEHLDPPATEMQQKILDGIQNNEKLLKDNNKLLKDHDKLLEEILEKLNNLTKNGE